MLPTEELFVHVNIVIDDLIAAHSAGQALWAVSPASNLIAAVTFWPGSPARTIRAGAGTCSGSRLSCAVCTVVLLAR